MKGVIFDFNGTLVFDRPASTAGWKAVFSRILEREVDPLEVIGKIAGTKGGDFGALRKVYQLSGKQFTEDDVKEAVQCESPIS